MSNDNFILTPEDERFLTREALEQQAHYEGDHEVMLMRRAMARALLLNGNPKLESEALQLWLDGPVSALNGPTRLMNVLQNCEFATVRQVYEAGYVYLMKQDNFGLRCKDDLEAIFRDRGLILRPQPTHAPLKQEITVEDNPANVTLVMPLKLLSDMVNACHHNLANYERQHGRFASRGAYKKEHDRLLALVQCAEDLIKPFEDRD